MSKNSIKKESDIAENKKNKKKYNKPKVKSEKIMMFGALCNGTSTGGRKQTTAGGCASTKLLS